MLFIIYKVIIGNMFTKMHSIYCVLESEQKFTYTKRNLLKRNRSYICICIYIYTHMYIIHIYVYIHTYVYHTYICIYTHICISYIYMYIYTHMYIIHIYVYIHTYVYIRHIFYTICIYYYYKCII